LATGVDILEYRSVPSCILNDEKSAYVLRTNRPLRSLRSARPEKNQIVQSRQQSVQRFDALSLQTGVLIGLWKWAELGSEVIETHA
jgi:hypothetical protein